MKHILILMFLLGMQKLLFAQYVYTINADSVKITNHCDTAELIIENHTQNVPGFLYNKGRGRTEFRRALVQLDDTTFLIGGDTMHASLFSLWSRNNNFNDIYNINTGNVGVNKQYPYARFDVGGDANVDSFYSIGEYPVLRVNYGAANGILVGQDCGLNSMGDNVVFVGNNSASFSTGDTKICVGNNAGLNSHGDECILIGDLAGLTSYGVGNICLGYLSGQSNAEDNLNDPSSDNVLIGYQTGAFGYGSNNCYLGYQSGLNNKGSDNQAVGYRAGSLATGSDNVNMGYLAGGYASGNHNCFIGYMNGESGVGDENIVIGDNAGNSLEGSNNVYLGNNAGNDVEGSSSIFMGYQAGLAGEGSHNVAIGEAGGDGYTGSFNVLLGDSAGLYFNGNYNTLLGARTGASLSAANFTGITLVGNKADVTATTDISNATALGANAVVKASNTMVFGDTAVTTWLFNSNATPATGKALIIGSNATNGNGAYLTTGGVWTNASDRNKKEHFEPVNTSEMLDQIADLPITRWNYKGLSEQHIGPVAQDFYRVFHLGTDDKTISTIDPAGIALAGVQGLYRKWQESMQQSSEQQSKIADQQAQITTLQSQVQQQQAELESQRAQLAQVLEKLNSLESNLNKSKPSN